MLTFCHYFSNNTGLIPPPEKIECDVNFKVQEGWLSPTERASVSAISLRHIIWLPHESHADMFAFTRFAGGGIWLPQESLRYAMFTP